MHFMQKALTTSLGIVGAGMFTVLPVSANERAVSEALSQQAQVPSTPGATTPMAEPTLIEIATSNEEFSTLVTAIEATDLVATLSGEGPFTIFAPTNGAFDALQDGALEALLLPENQDLLEQVLTYHVVQGEVTSDDLRAGPVTTLQGSDVEIGLVGGVMVDDAMVIMADIEASNGVIHAIDTVILPEELIDELQAAIAEAELDDADDATEGM